MPINQRTIMRLAEALCSLLDANELPDTQPATAAEELATAAEPKKRGRPAKTPTPIAEALQPVLDGLTVVTTAPLEPPKVEEKKPDAPKPLSADEFRDLCRKTAAALGSLDPLKALFGGRSIAQVQPSEYAELAPKVAALAAAKVAA